MKSRNHLRRHSGLTLLEVLIAMVILGASLLLLLNMGVVALGGNEWSNNTTRATQLLQQKLEQIRSSGDFSNGEETVENVDLSWTTASVGSHLRRVDISATWKDMGAGTHTNTITAFIKSDSV